MKIKMNIKKKLTLCFLAASIIPISLQTLIITKKNKETILAEIKKNQESIVREKASKLESYLNSFKENLVNIALYPPIQGIIRSHKTGVDENDKSSLEQWQNRLKSLFKSFQKSHPDLSYISFQKDYKNQLVRYALGTLATTEEDRKIEKILDKETFLEKLKALQPFGVSTTQVEIQDNIYIFFGIEIYDLSKMEHFGQILIGIDPKKFLTELTSSEKMDRTFLLLDKTGVVLNNNNYTERLWKKIEEDKNYFTKQPELQKNILIAETKFYHDEEDMEFRTWEKIFYEEGNSEKFFLFLSVLKSEVVLAPITESTYFLLSLLLFFSFLATILAFAIANSISSPLQKITNEAKEIAKGERQEPSQDVKTGDEIEDLSLALGEMTHNLISAEERTKAVIEGAIDGIITINETGIIQSFNSACQSMFQYTPHEVLGKNINMLMPEPYQSEHNSYLENYKHTGKKKIIGIGREVSGLKKNGETFPLELSVSEIQLHDQKIFCGFVRDLSDKKEKEKELREAIGSLKKSNESLEQFAYVASHDLQEPLRMVGSYAQLLEKRYKANLDEQASTYIDFIVTGAKRMRSLIDSVLHYSRLSQGKLIKVEIDTQNLLEQTVKNLNTLIEKSSTQVSFKELPTIMGDEDQLGIVFQNLIENGIKYCDKEKPVIEISARERSDDQIVFSIKDNGKGIEREYYDKVFQLFQRLEQNTTYSGTGIGLANVKKIIELHGGEIWIDSVVGEGTTFSFTLDKPGKEENV